MRPVFNSSSDRPYTVYGTVSVTFTPDRDQLHWVQLHSAAGMLVNENNVFVYRSRIWTEASFEERTGSKAAAYGAINDVTAPVNQSDDTIRAMEVDTADTTDNDYLITTAADALPTDDIADDVLPTEPSTVATATGDNLRPVRQFGEIAVTAVVAQPLDDTLTVSVAVPLRRGHFYVIKLGFAAAMLEANGFRWTAYNDGEFGGTIADSGQLVAFPHFRDVRPVTVDLEVIRPAAMGSLATAVLLNTEPV